MPKGVYQRKDAKSRFMEKVDTSGSCHEWKSTLHRDGYGKFYFMGKQVQAHRAAYMLFVGDIKVGKWVLHKCDNRKCVNPDHLYVGDAKQNVADMHKRGRNIGNTKYGTDIVNLAKEMYIAGFSQQAIAYKLGVNQTTVSKYVRGDQARLTKEK